jgi:Sulfotransferase family
MKDGINKPIFVVGSPRSGTSVLTWCLGKHPNIIPLEESDWLGKLAVDLAVYYQIGTSRGDYSLLSSMDVGRAEFLAAFGKSINDLILRHRVDLDRKCWRRAAGPNIPSYSFVPRYNTRTRWVDGTPENSLHICGLRQLFPEARFIHIFRDVTSVVRSMLHFHQVSGQTLVASAQEAYSYWLRTVTNCLLAERAYGPNVVFRIRQSDLVDAPEGTLRSVFSFLDEPFAPECLEPLAQRINSSKVPADFEIDDRAVDPSLTEQATRLCQQVEASSQALEVSAAAIEEIEAAFDKRVQFVATLAREYRRAQEVVARQQKENQQVVAWLQKENQQIAIRANRLASEVKRKRAIIQHLRGRRQDRKRFRSPLRILQAYFRRGKPKDEGSHHEKMQR